MFALAAKSFDKVSETFIRLHAEQLAPGRSVFLSEQPVNGPRFDAAVISGLRRGPCRIDEPGQPPRRFGPMSRLTSRRQRRLSDFLSAHGVRAVMAEYGTVGARLWPLLKGAETRFYVHFHGYDASRMLNDPAQVAAYQPLFENCQGIFAPSRFLANKLAGVGCPENKLHITPCGIDTASLPITKARPGMTVAVGRFVEKKAPQHTIAAFQQALAEVPQAELHFVGDGPLWQICKDHVAAAGLSDRIHLYGARDHAFVRSLLSEASIFLQHSVTAADGDTEGLPVAILEAMASGLCVISTHHSGIPEAVTNGTDGLLVEEHDIAGMASALVHVMKDGSYSTLGAAARKTALRRFDASISLGILREVMELSSYG